MSRNRVLVRLIPILIAVAVVMFQRCTAEKFVNEAGRTTKLALSRDREAALGMQAYREVLTSSQLVQSGPQYEMVVRCARRLAAATAEAGKSFQWHVSLVESPQVNAFCLPGGKICVYTGILPVAQTETGLAVVMGHEMAHATLRHGSERMLNEQAAQTIMGGVGVALGDMDYNTRRMVMGAIGAGAQYGVLNPFSRQHESEADAIGLRYMARAGYDPREAVAFWQRMSSTGGKTPPEFLSTHPSHETRVQRLKEALPEATRIYDQATNTAIER